MNSLILKEKLIQLFIGNESIRVSGFQVGKTRVFRNWTYRSPFRVCALINWNSVDCKVIWSKERCKRTIKNTTEWHFVWLTATPSSVTIHGIHSDLTKTDLIISASLWNLICNFHYSCNHLFDEGFLSCSLKCGLHLIGSTIIVASNFSHIIDSIDVWIFHQIS